jgi:hypothetical protein
MKCNLNLNVHCKSVSQSDNAYPSLTTRIPVWQRVSQSDNAYPSLTTRIPVWQRASQSDNAHPSLTTRMFLWRKFTSFQFTASSLFSLKMPVFFHEASGIKYASSSSDKYFYRAILYSQNEVGYFLDTFSSIYCKFQWVRFSNVDKILTLLPRIHQHQSTTTINRSARSQQSLSQQSLSQHWSASSEAIVSSQNGENTFWIQFCISTVQWLRYSHCNLLCLFFHQHQSATISNRSARLVSKKSSIACKRWSASSKAIVSSQNDEDTFWIFFLYLLCSDYDSLLVITYIPSQQAYEFMIHPSA